MGLGTVNHLAKRAGAIAAVNGGFFSPRTGEPQGTLVLNHNLVSRAMLNRPSLVLAQFSTAPFDLVGVEPEQGCAQADNLGRRPTQQSLCADVEHPNQSCRVGGDDRHLCRCVQHRLQVALQCACLFIALAQLHEELAQSRPDIGKLGGGELERWRGAFGQHALGPTRLVSG